MGDAMSDMIKGQRRHELYCSYLQALIWWVEVPSEENKKRVFERAALDQGVGPAFTGKETPFDRRMEEKLQKLGEKDKQAWAELLSKLAKGDFDAEYKRLKALSPFADQVFIIADYGRGFVHFYGDLKPMIASFVREKGGKTDCVDFVLVFPELPKPSEVIRVEHG